MKPKSHIAIGLMGLGVVGSGVAQALEAKATHLAANAGRPLRLKSVLVRDPNKRRSHLPEGTLVTTDPSTLLLDDDLDVVVELMGGVEPAGSYVMQAIDAGKHVVTANKELLAKHGAEIMAHAAKRGVCVRFEASVGGGIPIIGPLIHDLAANDLTAVNAIINGTTNYMLTRMAQDGIGYADALREAQALGYAESNPTDDVEGIDAAYKLAILTSLAFHTTVRASDVYHEGIGRLAPSDFRYAAELGYVIKLLAIGRANGEYIQARVHPAFLPATHSLAKVDGVYNAVELEGDLVDWTMFQGPGAGSLPTASAVIGDVLHIARALGAGIPLPALPSLDRALAIQPTGDLETKYYLRLRATDRPGVMAQITRVLGDLQVSLASVIQREVPEANQSAEIVITTHLAKEASVQEAARQIERLDVVESVSNLVRMEDVTSKTQPIRRTAH